MHVGDRDVAAAELAKGIIHISFFGGVCGFFISSTLIQLWCLFTVWKPDELCRHFSHSPDSPGKCAKTKKGPQSKHGERCRLVTFCTLFSVRR